jgi:hypothetical protein
MRTDNFIASPSTTRTEAKKVIHTGLLQRCWSEDLSYSRYVARANVMGLTILSNEQYAQEMVNRDEYCLSTSFTNFEF